MALCRFDWPRTGGVEVRQVRDEVWPERAGSTMIDMRPLSLKRHEAVLVGSSARAMRSRPQEKIRLEDPAAKAKLALHPGAVTSPSLATADVTLAVNFSRHVRRAAGLEAVSAGKYYSLGTFFEKPRL